MSALTDDQIVAIVADYKPGKRMNPVPGMPVSHLPISDTATVQRLIAAGRLTLIEVTKPSKVDPTREMTYAYLAVPR